MSDEIQTPSWAQLMQAAARKHAKSMFGGWLPGRVTSYDSAKNKAEIEIVIEDVYMDEGERQHTPFPILTNVPIQFPGSGGVRVKFPVNVGDFVTVMFASRSVDRWLAQGGSRVDPGDDRDHDLSDAVAIPGLLPFNGVSNAAQMVNFTGTTIEVGGTAALALVSELNALRAALVSHTHPAPGGTTSASLTIPASNYPGTQVIKGA